MTSFTSNVVSTPLRTEYFDTSTVLEKTFLENYEQCGLIHDWFLSHLAVHCHMCRRKLQPCLPILPWVPIPMIAWFLSLGWIFRPTPVPVCSQPYCVPTILPSFLLGFALLPALFGTNMLGRVNSTISCTTTTVYMVTHLLNASCVPTASTDRSADLSTDSEIIRTIGMFLSCHTPEDIALSIRSTIGPGRGRFFLFLCDDIGLNCLRFKAW